MRKPSAGELLLASMILDGYEATDETGADASAARKVAEWLNHCAEEAELAAACKAAGVRVSAGRRALRARKLAAALAADKENGND